MDQMLSPYRVLDLTDEKGLFCGKLMGDMGADVIKIEPPGGSAARNEGPFYHDEPDPEKSLFWFAYNTSKRGITLNLETVDGRELFKKLAAKADFIIESYPPGYLDGLGLGYAELEKINKGLILVSITPFGQAGPYRDYKTADIVAWGMGGEMWPFGDVDHPPTRISYHSQAYLHAATDALAGALVALYYRNATGEGQQVDVSIQEAVVNCTEHITSAWDLRHINQSYGRIPVPGHSLTRLWPCKDGYVSWFFWSGVMSVRTNGPLVEWLKSENMADEFLLNYDWNTFEPGTDQEIIDKMEAPTKKFFLSHTKAELFEGALKFGVQLYPVSTPEDMLKSPQLEARNFWQQIEHEDLGESITYPGPFAASTEATPAITRRAPHIGEHNTEVYQQELNLTREQIIILKEAGVI